MSIVLKRSCFTDLATMASILGKLISPKPAALGSILLGSWAYGAAAGARHLSAEVGALTSRPRTTRVFFDPNSRLRPCLGYILTWPQMGRSLEELQWSSGVMLFQSKSTSRIPPIYHKTFEISSQRCKSYRSVNF